MPNQSPEQLARDNIDASLRQCGWTIQDKKKINFSAALGIAVREYQTDTGPADYILFVEKKPVGVIEAKRPEESNNQFFMLHVGPEEQLYIGLIHTGAYQESLGGYGGIQHCLIPATRHVIIDEKNGKVSMELFAEEQEAESMLKILGY